MTAFGPFANQNWKIVLCGNHGMETREIGWSGDRPPTELCTPKPIDATLASARMWDADRYEDGQQPEFMFSVDHWRLVDINNDRRRAWYDLMPEVSTDER
jgi:hypothetical protein